MSNNITVGFSAKDVSFTETVKKVNKSTETIDDTVKKVSKSVGASFGSMVKAGAALAVGFGALNIAGNAIAGSLADFGKALDLGGTLQDLSQRTGETAGNLMILQRAFENSGSSAEAVGPMVNKLQKFMIDAANGSDKNVAALKMLGLTYDELKEKSPTEQLSLISAGFQGIGNDSQRTATAVAVFGKAGGELLPLLRNMSGEIGVAKSQLGSMPDIMNRSAEIFDNISDNINVIKGKFIEFAAGLMDRMAPALELVTSLLSRIDTAAIGMRLGEVLTGGSNAMDGFAAALQAVNMGEFGNAFNLVFSSIKLQIADSINSIYSTIKGVMAAIPVLLDQSGIMIIIDSFINGIINKVSAAVRTVVADFLATFGLLKKSESEDMMNLAKADEARANNYFTIAKAGFASIGENAKAAMQPMKEAYDKAKADSGQLIDTVKMENELQNEKLRLLKAQNEESIKRINMDEVALSLQIKGGGERASNAEKIKEFEADISQARSEGNTQLVKELEQQKLYYTTFQKALKEGKTTSEAMTAATQAQGSSLQNNLSIEQQITAQKKEQLTASQQMNADIKKAEEGQRLDSSGKIKKRFDEAMGSGNFASARRQARTLSGREEDIKMQDMFDKVTGAIPSKINTSVANMAKELEIDTKGMNRKETEEAVRDALEKAPAIDAPGKNGQPGAPGEPKGGDKAGGPNKLETIAEAIRTLVAKIEPKLPQMALGA